MSNFEFIKIKTDKVLESRSSYLVKPNAERWKNFPPCCLPESYLNLLERVKEFRIYEDDIILTGYPRSGTTRVAEMIWLMVNDFDFKKANQLVTDDRVPGLE